jgi:hypothetical protein
MGMMRYASNINVEKSRVQQDCLSISDRAIFLKSHKPNTKKIN